MASRTEIVAWLRMRDTARFRRDAFLAAEAIKSIKKAAEDNGVLNQMGGALGELGQLLPQTTGRTRLFGFAVGTIFTAAALALPFVIALGGALVALAGSLGAAALGAGAFGVALAGAAVPLAAFAFVAADLFQGFSKTSTAFTNWQKQVHAFGQNSTQAETALSRLNATAKVFGGTHLIVLVQHWNDFIQAMRDANKGAIHNIIDMFDMLLQAGMKLMPVFSALATMVSAVLKAGLGYMIRVFTGTEMRGILVTLGQAFQMIAGPLIRAGVNFLMGLFQLAARMSPFLSYLVDDVVRLSVAFRDWATNGSIHGIVTQFFSWYGLLKAVGRLFIALLSGGARQGQGMVDQLTAIVNKWTAWLNTMHGQNSLQRFFHDSIALTEVFVKMVRWLTVALFKIGRAAMPIFTKAFGYASDAIKMFLDALRPAKPFWDNVLKPMLEGAIGGLLTALVGAFKTVIGVMKLFMRFLGFIGSKLGWAQGIFKVTGWILAFIFGGEVLKALEWLGKLNILLRPIGWAFRLLGLPIRLAGDMVGFFGNRLGWLFSKVAQSSSRLLSPFRTAIDGILNFLQRAGGRFVNAGAFLWRSFRDSFMRAIGSGIGFAGDIAKSVANAVIHFLNVAIPNKIPIPGPVPDINLPDNPIPMLAGGGMVSGSGSWITGEAGPELNTLRNGRVNVVPLSPAYAAQSTNATLVPNNGTRPVVVSKVYLRGRQIAEAVADEVDDERHR